MGIVSRQSTKNIFIIGFSFLVGATNTLYLYPNLLKADYYGLVIFLLATSNLLMPLMSTGMQHAILKFYSAYESDFLKGRFLALSLFIPLIVVVPSGLLGWFFHDQLAHWLSLQNPIITDYVWVIFLVAYATAYFEIFYAWARVQFASVVGMMLKEAFPRMLVLVLLLAVMYGLLTKEQFIWWLTGGYFLRLLLMMSYAFTLQKPQWYGSWPTNIRAVFSYAFYILLAGSAASLLLDIDKTMIPQKQAIAQTAYYGVAVYMATLVEVPGRALFQILNPLVAKAINDNNFDEVQDHYKNSTQILLTLAGLVFVLINIGAGSVYAMMGQGYGEAVWVVLMISFSKLVMASFGCGPAILANASHYRATLPFSLAMAFSLVPLNYWLIDLLGINGAALSTLLVIVFFTMLKIAFIKHKMNLYPYQISNLFLLIVVAVFYVLGLQISFPGWSPLALLILRCLVVGVGYLATVFALKLSPQLNQYVWSLIALVSKRGPKAN